MNFKNLLKRVNELDNKFEIYFTGRTLSEDDMILSDEDRDKAIHGYFETDRGLFCYTKRLYESFGGEFFIISELKYLFGNHIQTTIREYNEEGILIKRSLEDSSGINEIEFNPVLEEN